MTQSDSKIPFSLLAAIVAAALMSFCGVASETAMNVVFPSLMTEFSVTTATVQWLTTGYLLMLSLVIPLSSFFKRRFSTRALFIAAVSLFIAGTLLCYFAPGFGWLLGGRLLQGAGTGVALPLMYNIILAETPKSRLGLMMGFAVLISSLAPALGPVLGGVMTEIFGWRSIFLLLLPLLLLSLVLGLKFIRPLNAAEAVKFDLTGYVLLALAFTAFIFATEKAAEYGWTSAQVLAALVLLAVFVRRSLKSDNPLVNLQVFSRPVFVLALKYLLLVQFGVLAMGFLLPNVAQLALGQSALVAGFLLLPATLLGAVMSPLGGRLLDRLGAAKPILAGGICVIAAFALFALFSHSLSVGLIIALAMLCFLGVGLSSGNAMTFALSALEQNRSADGNAVINTLQQLAGALGTSVSAVLVASAQQSAADLAQGTATGARHTFILLTVLAVIATLCVAAALKKQRTAA